MYAGTGEGFYNSDGIRGAGVFTSTDGGTTWSQLAVDRELELVLRQQAGDVAGRRGDPRGDAIGRLPLDRRRGPRGPTPQATEMTGVVVPPDGFDQGDRDRLLRQRVFLDQRRRDLDGGHRPARRVRSCASRRRTRRAPRRRCTRRSTRTAARSTRAPNGGASYAVVFNGAPDYLETQGWYDNAIWVDPTNANNLIVGGIDLWKSTNGGVSLDQDQRLVAVAGLGARGSARHRRTTGVQRHDEHESLVRQRRRHLRHDRTSTRSASRSPHRRMERLQQQSGHHAVLRRGRRHHDRRHHRRHAGQRHAQAHDGRRHDLDHGVRRRRRRVGRGSVEQQQPVRRIHLRRHPSQHRRRRHAPTGSTGSSGTASSYVCKAAPYHDRRHRATRSQANFIAPFILDPNNSNRLLVGGDVALADQRRDDAEHRDHRAVVGQHQAGERRRQLHQRHCRRPGQFERRSGSGTTTDSCSRRPTARRARRRGRRAAPARFPTRFITRVRVDPTDANTVYVTYGGFSTGNVWKTTNGGTSWASASGSGVDRAAGRAGSRHRRLRTAARPGCMPRPKSACSRARTAAARGRVPGDGPANVSIEELFWMGSSLVAVTHGRGLFTATPSTDPVDAGDHLAGTGSDHGRHGAERDAVERHDHRARHLRLFAGGRDGAGGRERPARCR